MDQLIELLQQIQDLAGTAVDALKQASGDAEKPDGKPEGGPPREGGSPDGPPPGGPPKEEMPPRG